MVKFENNKLQPIATAVFTVEIINDCHDRETIIARVPNGPVLCSSVGVDDFAEEIKEVCSALVDALNVVPSDNTNSNA